MLKDAALLQLDLLLASLERGPRAEGLHALQRAVQGRAADVRGRRLVRAHARGRAVGRLPPVLHALPLPAAAPVGEGRAVPALAARLDRRHHARGDARADVVPRPLPQGRLHERVPARAARGSYADRPEQVKQEVSAALQEGAVRRQRAQDAQARRAALLGSAARASGPPTASATATPTTTPRRKDELRARGGHAAATGTSSGTSAQQRPLLAHRRRGRAHGRGRGRRPGPGRAALPRPARRGATRRSSRSR